MLKVITVANIVRDAKVLDGKEGKFTALSVAIERPSGETIYPELTVNGDAAAEFLKKGRQVFIVADDLQAYTYEKDGKTGTSYRMPGAQVQFGDAVYTVVYGRLVAPIEVKEGATYGHGTLLSNVKQGKDEIVVTSGFIFNEKLLEKVGPYLKKGKKLALAGFSVVKSWSNGEKNGAELSFNGSPDFTLGPDPRSADAPATADASEDSGIPD